MRELKNKLALDNCELTVGTPFVEGAVKFSNVTRDKKRVSVVPA
jgi:hypothetical protein